jgi:hypothetical protein
MKYIHKRDLRIRGFKGVQLSKTIVAPVFLNREKDWNILMPELNIHLENNSFFILKNELLNILHDIHIKYIEGTLEKNMVDIYKNYVERVKPLSKSEERELLRKQRKNKNEENL